MNDTQGHIYMYMKVDKEHVIFFPLTSLFCVNFSFYTIYMYTSLQVDYSKTVQVYKFYVHWKY